ncbi:hypothetical protein B0H11DRAFT_317207 [Mycena galericulata]|nr:hypothetical protein B0H11DRAFT_317207 [Mycena galericulata]
MYASPSLPTQSRNRDYAQDEAAAYGNAYMPTPSANASITSAHPPPYTPSPGYNTMMPAASSSSSSAYASSSSAVTRDADFLIHSFISPSPFSSTRPLPLLPLPYCMPQLSSPGYDNAPLDFDNAPLGFARGYNRVLELIDLPQATLLAFIDGLNIAMSVITGDDGVTGPLRVVDLIAPGLGFVPYRWAGKRNASHGHSDEKMKAGTRVLEKALTDRYLRAANQRLFRPRGLAARLCTPAAMRRLVGGVGGRAAPRFDAYGTQFQNLSQGPEAEIQRLMRAGQAMPLDFNVPPPGPGLRRARETMAARGVRFRDAGADAYAYGQLPMQMETQMYGDPRMRTQMQMQAQQVQRREPQYSFAPQQQQQRGVRGLLGGGGGRAGGGGLIGRLGENLSGSDSTQYRDSRQYDDGYGAGYGGGYDDSRDNSRRDRKHKQRRSRSRDRGGIVHGLLGAVGNRIAASGSNSPAQRDQFSSGRPQAQVRDGMGGGMGMGGGGRRQRQGLVGGLISLAGQSLNSSSSSGARAPPPGQFNNGYGAAEEDGEETLWLIVMRADRDREIAGIQVAESGEEEEVVDARTWEAETMGVGRFNQAQRYQG